MGDKKYGNIELGFDVKAVLIQYAGAYTMGYEKQVGVIRRCPIDIPSHFERYNDLNRLKKKQLKLLGETCLDAIVFVLELSVDGVLNRGLEALQAERKASRK